MVGKTWSITRWVTTIASATVASLRPSSTTPLVTHSAIGRAGRNSHSASASTTSAIHGSSRGSGLVVSLPSSSRSQGSVRRFSTICGSRELNAPSAWLGGKVESTWSAGSR